MDRIDALRLFARLAEQGSFSAAARQLKVKQSTASKWIAELEAELATSLVQRTTRSVHLTDAGRRLLARAQVILSAFDDMTGEFSDRAPEPNGRVRVSAPVVFGRLFVVPAVADFLAQHHQVQIELVLGDRYVNLIEEGFDLAVRVGVPTDTSARGRKLADSRRVLVAAPDYVTSRGQPRLPKDLEDHECLVHGDGNAAMVWRFGRARGADVPVRVHGRLAVNHSEAVLAMARRGLGIALLADWLVQADLDDGRLIPLLEEFTTPPAPIYVLSPPGMFTPAAVRALIEHLVAAMAAALHRAPRGSR